MKAIHKDLENKYYCQWIKFLKSTEKWNLEKIKEYQFKNLKTIITYAYKNTSGYRKLFDQSGVCPKDLKTIDDIQKFPFVTKEEIRDNLEGFSTKLKSREYITTGGSTGIPFGFYRDPVSFARELASKAYQYYRIGWKEGVRQMVFRGLPIETADHTQFFPEFNELRCSSYYFIPEQMEIYRQKAWEYRPDFIKCYSSSGYLFAKYLKESGKSFPKIKGVLCASENLYDFQKDLLSEVFKCRIFSHYGHYELAVMAGFCENEDTYHVLPYYGYAELINKNGELVTKPGETGEIIATSFIMKGTPFIRYRTRDFAVLKDFSCQSCGRPYQVWDHIEGRLQEFIVTKSGRYISMTAMNMHDNIFDKIRQFQYYQDKKGKLEFHFISKEKEELSVRELQAIKCQLLKKLGSDVDLSFEKVSIIPLTSRGKLRFLLQKLELKYGDK